MGVTTSQPQQQITQRQTKRPRSFGRLYAPTAAKICFLVAGNDISHDSNPVDVQRENDDIRGNDCTFSGTYREAQRDGRTRASAAK